MNADNRMQESSVERLYAERLNRYVTAMRNEKPDRVPIRLFAAEFAAKYAGYTCQEVTHDYQKAFAAVRKCAADFDWDATVGNMVYVWTGLTQALGLKYYAIPGIDIPADTGFQYREPTEQEAYMPPKDYDRLIEDPTDYLFTVWLPRVSNEVQPLGAAVTRRNNLALVKSGMAMLGYFMALGEQGARLRREFGMASAIAGILKAPLDIIADKLRGYVGLSADLVERPEKVLAACHALAPHLLHVALSGADPSRLIPVALWMHRGCVPFVSHEQFRTFYWPTLKPIIENIWAHGHQTLFYAEGDWTAHLDSFAELPERSIIYHVDRADVFETHRALGRKFCLSGGISNYLLAYGSPSEVRSRCREVLDGVGQDGGYIMDASAILQNDACIENVRTMTEFVREYGVYSDTPSSEPPAPAAEGCVRLAASDHPQTTGPRPGVCIPWEEKMAELPPAASGHALIRQIWEDIDSLAYTFIWHCLVSF